MNVPFNIHSANRSQTYYVASLQIGLLICFHLPQFDNMCSDKLTF